MLAIGEILADGSWKRHLTDSTESLLFHHRGTVGNTEGRVRHRPLRRRGIRDYVMSHADNRNPDRRVGLSGRSMNVRSEFEAPYLCQMSHVQHV